MGVDDEASVLEHFDHTGHDGTAAPTGVIE
jgi:hypothetical protein